jgi:hypothetical protein
MKNEIYFGFARRNINPQVATSLAGYFNPRMWENILDDLEVRVLVLRRNVQYTAIVQFDLVAVSQDFAEAFYSEIADIAELRRDNMIVTATHSHTAPEIRSRKPGFNAEYIPFVVKQAADALREAVSKLQSGTMVCGKTFEDRFAFNRRYWMKDGSVVTNPGKLNPEIDRPEGETDPEIPLLGIMKDGKLQVLIANIVNHTDTIGGNDVSADWPGFMIKKLQAEMGSGSMVLPLIGCSGNMNHFDVSTDKNQTSYAEAERVGNGYADTISRALDSLKPLDDCAFNVKSCKVFCGPREISDAELAEAKAVLEKYKDTPDEKEGVAFTSEDLAKKAPPVLKYFARTLIDMGADKTERIFTLVGIFIGDVCIVSLPSEPFVEIGLEIKRQIFPDKLTMVVSHSNGTGAGQVGGGYIPNNWNYGRGGYETTPRSNPFSVKTAEQLLQGVRSLAS